MPSRPTVLIVQRRLTHYRVPFFELLLKDLRNAGVHLQLAHGLPTPTEARKQDSGFLPWAEQLRTHYALGDRLCWQPFSHLAGNAALTVVTAENKLLCNLGEQFGARGRRVALWGHGANLQGDPSTLRERFKARVALAADWWFAYTQLSEGLIASRGFPPDRITVLNNTVDTVEMRQHFAAVSIAEQVAMRSKLGLGGGPTGLYLGSLYAEKRIGFLLEAAAKLRNRLPGFTLLVVGDGPQRDMVAAAASRSPWIKPLGVQKGSAKALMASLAQVMLNPGLVGLNILDSFANGLPMVTTDCGLHSPEIAYLEPGANGVMTANDIDVFVEACVQLLENPIQLAAMKNACLAAAERYTLENMSARFTEGVLRALAAPIRRGRR